MLGPHVLKARDRLNGPLMGSLPDNQWQLEVQHWYAAVTAHLQGQFLRYTNGFTNPVLEKLITGPRTEIQQQMCANQKIRSEGFVSVSVFGLACILTGGCLICLLSFVVGPVLACYLDRKDRHSYAKIEWSVNETLQLQRLAQERSGMGTWSRGTESVPVTARGDLLAALDLTNPTHPILREGIGSRDNQQPEQPFFDDLDLRLKDAAD